MKRLGFILLFILVVSAGCRLFDFFSLGTAAGANQHLVTDTFEGVIFTANNAEGAGLQFEFNEPIVDYWTPTEAQVRSLEAGLIPFLEAEIAPDDYRYGFWEDLEFYRRQYFGIAFEADRPLIYANYFCVDQFDYWLEGYVMVMDGGDCFFQVLYDPATSTFSSLRINGEA